MLFIDKNTGQEVDLEVKSALDGGIDVIRREVVFEKHYKHFKDIYEDFDDRLTYSLNQKY